METHYIDEVLKGNTNAFSYFIRTYQDKAYGVAIAIVKVDEDAKDVVQDSFLTAYSSLGSFRNDAKFSTWFYRIVVNKALQFIKRRERIVEVARDYWMSDEEKSACNEAISQLRKQDLKHLIKKVFAKMPSKETLVLQLYYIDDQDIMEIEEITAFSKSNVKVLLHRGRGRFYKILKEENITNHYWHGR